MQTHTTPSAILRRLSRLLVPQLCPVCGCRLTGDEDAMCAACLMGLPRTMSHYTGLALGREALANGVAPTRLTAAWFVYNPGGPWAPLIRLSKYSDRPALARSLGSLYATELLADGVTPPDVLMPVPIHWRKRLGRGYNQSVEIARGMGRVMNVPVADNLVATHPHQSQTHLGHSARRSNVEGCMTLRHPDELEGLDVCFVDDILTTGSTIAECARAVSCAGARPGYFSLLVLGLASGG